MGDLLCLTSAMDVIFQSVCTERCLGIKLTWLENGKCSPEVKFPAFPLPAFRKQRTDEDSAFLALQDG